MSQEPQVHLLADHLFRHEAGKILSVLTRIFGPENLDLAEDVVQDSLLEAITQWQFKGIPENPSGWLFKVAKNKALNILDREKYKRKYATEMNHLLKPSPGDPSSEDFFSPDEIQDDQLRMIFTCCHPAISPDSQVALALKTLCGFSIPEIARGFLTTEDNIHKRLVRARQKIREDQIAFEVPSGKDLEKKLNTVLETIYLLFNEGYSASSGDRLIRYELCEEAIRMAQMLATHPAIERKEIVYALLALMHLNASRFQSRQDEGGNLLTMDRQDRNLWDYELIDAGLNYLELSTKNESISIYHIMAAISANYCIAPNYESTHWRSILSLYDSLIELDHSPVILLNRAIVLSKIEGIESGLAELKKFEKDPLIRSYHLFYTTQGEFYVESKQFDPAIQSFERAKLLAPLQAERDLLENKIKYCQGMKNTEK